MRRAVVHARGRAVVVRSAIGAVVGALVLIGVNYDGPSPGSIVSASLALEILLTAAVAYAVVTVASVLVHLGSGDRGHQPPPRR